MKDENESIMDANIASRDSAPHDIDLNLNDKPICGRCSKYKGDRTGDFCKCGRPNGYDPSFIGKAYEYLDLCQDEYKQVIKQANEEKGYEMYENKLQVKLPTLQGLSSYLDCDQGVMNGWGDQHPEFSRALGAVMKAQHDRLLNKGLSNEYNPTIAKLILSSNHGYAEKNETKHSGELTWLNQAHEAKQDTIGNAG